jgi:polyisoprenoid-binding protein YceI
MMKRRLLILTIAATLFSSGLIFAAEKYKVDRVHSNVLFSVKHMVISTVQGGFNQFQGTIVYDKDDIMSFSAEGTIDVNSIDTNNERRDKDLLSSNFFEVEKYPEIKFKTYKVEKREDGYVAIGNLTIKDVTKEVEIPFEVAGPIKGRRGMLLIGLQASIKINRKDFNMTWHRTLDGGGLVVSDEVKIELNVEARQQSEEN